MTVVHRNSLMLRRHARAMRLQAMRFRTQAAQGVVIQVKAETLLELAELLEDVGGDLARVGEAVDRMEAMQG